MQKLINSLTVLAIEQHRFKRATHVDVNAAKPTDAIDKEWLIKQFDMESAKYKATVLELCLQITLAEAMAVDEEVYMRDLVGAANLAISLHFSKQKIYNAIVDAIDFVFIKTV